MAKIWSQYNVSFVTDGAPVHVPKSHIHGNALLMWSKEFKHTPYRAREIPSFNRWLLKTAAMRCVDWEKLSKVRRLLLLLLL